MESAERYKTAVPINQKPSLIFHLSMSEVQMNYRPRPQREGPVKSFFITANYAEMAITDKHQAILEDLQTFAESV